MKILATNTIRAGRFATMNDPREAKRWIFSGPENFGEDPTVFWRMECAASVAATWIQSNLRVVAFSLDDVTRKGADPESPLRRNAAVTDIATDAACVSDRPGADHDAHCPNFR